MNVEISGKQLHGKLNNPPSSKSQTHRALICAALSDKPTEIISNCISNDINATINCLSALGASFGYSDDKIFVQPINKASQNAVLDCNESGSTLRFLLPVAAALNANCSFVGNGLLSKRPLSPLYEELIAHGVKLSEQGTFPLLCNGRLTNGIYKINGGISSQFISGLLFALPLLNNDSIIQIEGTLQSSAYVDMTINCLNKFGIQTDYSGNSLKIKSQKYHSPEKLSVETDWSNSAFWLCAGALSEKGITVSDLSIESNQGDKQIIDILKQFGADVSISRTDVTVKKLKLNPIKINASEIPDLVPVVSAVAAFADGVTEINGVHRLRYKESDRILAILDLLNSFGVNACFENEKILIHGEKIMYGGTVSSHNDHRIAMSASILAAFAQGKTKIIGCEATKKSYPDFFRDFKQLNGEVY